MNKLHWEQKQGANSVPQANTVPGNWLIRIEAVTKSRVSDLHQNTFNSKPGTSAGGDQDQDLQKQGKAGNLEQSRPETVNCKGAEQGTGVLSYLR